MATWLPERLEDWGAALGQAARPALPHLPLLAWTGHCCSADRVLAGCFKLEKGWTEDARGRGLCLSLVRAL